MSQRHGHCTTCDALLLPAAVSVRAARNDWAAAEAFCRQLSEAAGEYGSRTWLAMARQARGELGAARGKREEALALYAEAREGFSRAGNHAEAEQCQAALAALRGAPVQPVVA
jgi:predicted negative regulator of RcsB-dependent stress response